MARVIHATTMKPRMAKPCCVAGSSGSGANQITSGTMMQRIWPITTTGEFGSSVRSSAEAIPVSAVVMAFLRGVHTFEGCGASSQCDAIGGATDRGWDTPMQWNRGPLDRDLR